MSETPQTEWPSLVKLLPLCIEFAEKKHAEGAINPHEAISRIGEELGIQDVDKFAVDKLQKVLTEGMGFAFENAAAKEIAAVFAKSSGPVMIAAVKFAQKATNETEFVQTLNELCLGSATELQAILQKSLGIPASLADSISNTLGPYTVSVYCFAAAFKIYKSAAADAKAAKERRIEIESLSNEAIAKLKAERAEMDKLLSDWMIDRLLPFSEGVQAMDRAILEDDDNAYIAANADLWNLLGREAAYSTASEFDDLMLSDEAFRL